MKSTKRICAGMFLIAAIAIASTGCMTTPGSGEHVGKKQDKIAFNGWTANANQNVYLYAMTSYNTWQYVGYAKTGPSGYNHFGVNWYFWHASIKLPANCWHNTGLNNESLAVIQARDSNGDVLYTFKEGFYSWYDDYDNLNEMYSEKGNHADSIVIYADNN